MTFKVPKSRIIDFDAFDAAINRYCHEMAAHAQTIGKPRPSAHPLVEQCVRRVEQPGKPDQFVPDYEVINDDPRAVSAGPMSVSEISLSLKKDRLQQAVHQMEIVARHKVMPDRKGRLFHVNSTKAARVPEERQTDEDKAHLAHKKEIDKKLWAIEEISAQALAEIEDLNETNIDSWQLPSYDHV